jgi:thiol:disulfide interchange protein DsbD
MFGLYELQMPYWLTSRLGGTTTTGIIGIYFSGLVVGVFAAPCIGPPILALLAFVGTKGDPIFGFWTFFTLSCGLGFPYLVLGTFSGLLKRMPKSGVWMVWVKKVFGVVLMGVAFFYLGLALLPGLTVYVVPLTLFIGGIYLGFLERSGKQNTSLQRIRWAVGAVAVLSALLVLNTLRKPGVEWESYSPQRLQEARSANKAVMLDFYADWCIPCLELDRLTFTHPEVIKATKDFVRLKVDLTHYDSPEAERLRQIFNIIGVPTIVFLGPDGSEVHGTRIVGYLPPEEFIERLRPLLTFSFHS